jgi:hypothetical protein
MDQNNNKPKLVFFQFKYDRHLPVFLLTHKDEHVRCLSHFFDVTVVSEDCDYRQICDTYQPDLVLFESGVNHSTCKRLEITSARANPGIPKLGLHHGDGFCNARAGFLSDMDLWGIDTFFSIATTTAEHTPEIADRLFVWPVFVDADIYHDYGEWKSIPVLFTGNRNQFYPWRQQLLRAVTERYPSMICPHAGYGPQSSEVRVLAGEEYARTLNASWFVPTCGTVAKEVVRKHFEIGAARACLIAEQSAGLLAAGFADMKNCVFADAHTVLEKLDWLFNNPATLDNIINAGHELVHSRHTMRQRDQIFQWYTLDKQLTAGQKIVQDNPFEPLVVVEESSGRKSRHIASAGLHLVLLRKGDENLWRGRYEEAERCYLQCLAYMPWFPEVKLRLALANLYKGSAATAATWLEEPLHFVLHTYGAADPDPVEWAYLIISLLCLGKVSTANGHAAEFPGLSHPELDRARWVTAVLTHGDGPVPALKGDNGRRRRSLHQLPERSLDEWVAELCTMFAACKQSGLAETLKSHMITRPARGSAAPGCGILADENRAEWTGRRKTGWAPRFLGKRLLWRRLWDRVKRSTAQSLHRLEGKYGYFLPYPWSDARTDEFFGALRTVAREEHIKTAMVIGAAPGKYSTEAFLAGAIENPCKPRIFCICCSSRRPLAGRPRSASDRGIEWYELPHRTEAASCGLDETVGIVLDESNTERFDLIMIDASEMRQHAGNTAALRRLRGASVVVLKDLSCTASYAVYSALCADSAYVLAHHSPSVHSGYAIFRKASPTEDHSGSMRGLVQDP